MVGDEIKRGSMYNYRIGIKAKGRIQVRLNIYVFWEGSSITMSEITIKDITSSSIPPTLLVIQFLEDGQ